MLTYSLKVTMSLIQNRQFRNTVLGVLTKLYMGLSTPDFINVCQVQLKMFLYSTNVARKPDQTVALLVGLMQDGCGADLP